MNRCVFVPAALACSLVFASSALAQTAKPTAATPTGSTAPAAPAKFVPLVKGVAQIQYIPGPSKRVGKDVVTVFKVKNVSSGAIGLLRVDELWYNGQRQQISGDTETVKRILPGEVVEVTLKSPYKDGLAQSQYMFTHVNGKVDPKKVKAFD
jgi:hypothetical protein